MPLPLEALPPLRFNPRPQLQPRVVGPDQVCWVIDDVLLNPEVLRDWAVARRHEFAAAPVNAYPGIQIDSPEALTGQLQDYFAQHLRSRMGARRTLDSYARLALVTLQPAQLRSRQWLCHRDRSDIDPRLYMVAASVLYLFDQPALGGTSFFRPRLSAPALDALIQDLRQLPDAEFGQRHGVQPGYLLDSNNAFELTATVEPRWNRLIFYDGGLFHSAHAAAPELLSDDPLRGRLTLNGFFTCRRHASDH
jgi:hypothetical protein